MRLNYIGVILFVFALGHTVAQSDASEPNRALVISLEQHFLSVRLEAAPLRQVLAEVARQGGFRLRFSERLDNNVVSASFERLPLNEALQRLLAGWSHAVIYVASSVEQSRSAVHIAELIVFDRAGPLAEGLPDSDTPEATMVLANSGPQERIQALEQWVATRDGADINPLTHALVDPDEHVRARAQDLLEGLLSADSRQ
jgi:hypothetical protein